jgi:hypothetical protein
VGAANDGAGCDRRLAYSLAGEEQIGGVLVLRYFRPLGLEELQRATR